MSVMQSNFYKNKHKKNFKGGRGCIGPGSAFGNHLIRSMYDLSTIYQACENMENPENPRVFFDIKIGGENGKKFRRGKGIHIHLLQFYAFVI